MMVLLQEVSFDHMDFPFFLQDPGLEFTVTGRCRELPGVTASGRHLIPSILNFSDSHFSKRQQDVKQVAPEL